MQHCAPSSSEEGSIGLHKFCAALLDDTTEQLSHDKRANSDQRRQIDRCGAYLKSQVVGVAVVNGVINVFDADDRDDGAKGLLPCNAHVLHTPPLRLAAQADRKGDLAMWSDSQSTSALPFW